MRTSETGVVLNPVMDIDIGQVEDTRVIVSTEDASDHVGDIPTKSWSKVVVFADDFVEVLERDFTSISG